MPVEWKCDGIKDCSNGEDEQNCTLGINHLQMNKARESALKWTYEQRRNNTPTQKWGLEVARIIVGLYLAEDAAVFGNGSIKEEIPYEISLRVLLRLALRKIEDVPSPELASYIHALLVSCMDPRKFYLVDLVSELRKRLNTMYDANPFITLALCNAGDNITDNDVENLVYTFRKAKERSLIDVQVYAVLALSCAAVQNPKYLSEIKPLTSDLKSMQYENGTVENLKSTALVMQALFASQSEPDEKNFDEEKALKQILQSQQPDGSFGNIINTYYVLPVLLGKSLINISTSHCRILPKEEDDDFENVLDQVGNKTNVRYSLWIGDNKALGTTLSLKVPVNSSFYRVMELAAKIDHRFKFKYNVRNGKPYVYSLWNRQDDPEYSMFWIPYTVSDEEDMVSITKSPSEVIPNDKQHLAFWYKSQNIPQKPLPSTTH